MGKIIKEFFGRMFSVHANAFWVGTIGSCPVYLAFVSHLHLVWPTVILLLTKASAAFTLSFVTGTGAALSADFYKQKCKPKVDKLLKPKMKRNENKDDRAA